MPSLSESFPTLGLLVSGTRKLFSRPKKLQPEDESDGLPEDFFSDESVSPEFEDPADLAQIAYQAGAEDPLPYPAESGGIRRIPSTY